MLASESGRSCGCGGGGFGDTFVILAAIAAAALFLQNVITMAMARKRKRRHVVEDPVDDHTTDNFNNNNPADWMKSWVDNLSGYVLDGIQKSDEKYKDVKMEKIN